MTHDPPFETVKLPHLESYPLHIVLFRDVDNADFLRDQLLQGNSDFEYAFLDAAMITCREHLLAACFRAVNDMARGRLRTKNVHSEIVFCLSPNNNIAESFKRFGITPASKDIVAVKVATLAGHPSLSDVRTHLTDNVQGTAAQLSDAALADLRDLARLGKIYKLDIKPGAPASAAEEARMLAVITGTMALKGT